MVPTARADLLGKKPHLLWRRIEESLNEQIKFATLAYNGSQCDQMLKYKVAKVFPKGATVVFIKELGFSL